MKKSELKKVIKECILEEGTWAIPKSPAEGNKIKKELEKMLKSVYNVYGDDEVLDHLGAALDRMKELDSLKK